MTRPPRLVYKNKTKKMALGYLILQSPLSNKVENHNIFLKFSEFHYAEITDLSYLSEGMDYFPKVINIQYRRN